MCVAAAIASVSLPMLLFAQSDTLPGQYTDGPGSRFFEMLSSGQFDYVPTTFAEAVERSSVIARGNLQDVIAGRSVGISSSSTAPPLTTVFVKIAPSKLLKGTLEDYYLVEIHAPQQRIGELKDQLYTGDLLFLLRPATNLLVNPRISVSPEARAEWVNGKSLYTLTMQPTLFAMTGSGALASPLDAYRDFQDLYTATRSLEDLESRILSIQGGRTIRDAQTAGGSRQWYENTGESSALQGLVQEWYENGQLKSETNYYNGEREGPSRYWYESGALQAESGFTDGRLQGLSRYWFENGQLAMLATFENGNRVECQAWTEDGSPADCP
jgi:hypothetical protein